MLTYACFGAWRSPVAHLLWEQGVGGSNPLAPTILFSTSPNCLLSFADRNLQARPLSNHLQQPVFGFPDANTALQPVVFDRLLRP